MELIDKDAVMAEIDERLHKYEKEYEELARYEIWISAKEIELKFKELKNFRSFLDTLEVKETKEVNWTEEIIKAHEENGWLYPDDFALLEDVARHFYNLGLNARKEA